MGACTSSDREQLTHLPPLSSDGLARIVLNDELTQVADVSDADAILVAIKLGAIKRQAQHKSYPSHCGITLKRPGVAERDTFLPQWVAQVNSEPYLLASVWAIQSSIGQLEGVARFTDQPIELLRDPRLRRSLGSLDARELRELLTVQEAQRSTAGEGQAVHIIIDLERLDKKVSNGDGAMDDFVHNLDRKASLP